MIPVTFVACILAASSVQSVEPCELVVQYINVSHSVPANHNQRQQFLRAWRVRLDEFARASDASTCRTRALQAVFSLHVGLGDYQLARDLAHALLLEADTKEERLFAAHGVVSAVHQIAGNDMPSEQLAECRAAAEQGITGWNSLQEAVEYPAMPGAFRLLSFLRHVCASTEPNTDLALARLRALENELLAIQAEGSLANARDSEVETIRFELRLKLLLAGRTDDVLAELRALPDAFEGKTRAAMALLARCGCSEDSPSRTALEDFILSETTDLVSRFQVAQGVSIRLHKVILGEPAPAREDSERYMTAAQRVRRLLDELDDGPPIPQEREVSQDVRQMVWSETLYGEVQVAKYQLRDDALAVQLATEFLSRFPRPCLKSV